MSRFARKVDGNHKSIADGLRDFGCLVHSTAAIGGGFPDLFVGKGGRVFLLEVKDPKRPKSARKLTEAEEVFHRQWHGYPVHVVETLQQALLIVGAIAP
jgi:hypothetical protein